MTNYLTQFISVTSNKLIIAYYVVLPLKNSSSNLLHILFISLIIRSGSCVWLAAKIKDTNAYTSPFELTVIKSD